MSECSFASTRSHHRRVTTLSHFRIYAAVNRACFQRIRSSSVDRNPYHVTDLLQIEKGSLFVQQALSSADALSLSPRHSCYRNLASNYWAWRHGLPDLFIWRKDAAAWTSAGGDSGDPGGVKGLSESKAISVHEKVVQITVGSSNHDECPGYHDLSTNGNNGGTGERPGHGGSEGLRGNADVEPTVRRETRCQWLEVKGPGDSLSCYQEAWIDTLVRAGAEAVVLRIEDTASS